MATASTGGEAPVTDNESVSHSVMSDFLQPRGLYVAHQALLSMDSPGKKEWGHSFQKEMTKSPKIHGLWVREVGNASFS